MPRPADNEQIVAAAIRLYPATVTMVPPARHCHILEQLRNHGVMVDDPRAQGFITSSGEFVDRKTAKRVARRAGQLLPSASVNQELFSEDLW